jgi:hypothetical protein
MKNRWIALFLPGFAIVACTASPVTELVAGVSTQVQVPKELQAVEVSVSSGGVTSYCQHFDVVQGKVQLPKTLGVSKQDDSGPVTISIIGYLNAAADLDDARSTCPDDPTMPSPFADANVTLAPRVVRRSIQTYRDQHVAFVPMPLRFACFDNPCNTGATPATMTCKAGACVDANIDSSALADYGDDLIYGDANTCFSDLKCLASAQPPTLIDATNCLYSATGPAAASGDLNVRVIFDGFVSETLDSDPDEGFFIPDATKPNQFQLAPGLCHPASGAHKIISIAASQSCPTKTALQPLCNEGVQVLIPAPSAVYMLLDRSQSMEPLVTSTQGVGQILDLSLTDPGLATTEVGFKFVPSTAGVCTTTTYGTPDLKFEVATKAQSDIATLIANQATGTFPTAAPAFPVVLDKTGGVYSALSSANLGATAFNRRSVIIVTNNDVAALNGCVSTNVSTAQAAAALADPAGPIQTYVILLKNSGDPNPAQTLTNATNLAIAGGTTVFNATGSDAGPVSLNAINSVIADLSSCLYETPTNITQSSATLTINSPLGNQNIPFSATCSSTNTTTDGWNFDGARIRICGNSCSTIRQVLTNTASAANATLTAAPQVVVTASQPE